MDLGGCNVPLATAALPRDRASQRGARHL